MHSTRTAAAKAVAAAASCAVCMMVQKMNNAQATTTSPRRWLAWLATLYTFRYKHIYIYMSLGISSLGLMQCRRICGEFTQIYAADALTIDY